MGINITNHVDWIGKIDWELRKFHGEEYSTHRGSSYNAYLVRDELARAYAFGESYPALLK